MPLLATTPEELFLLIGAIAVLAIAFLFCWLLVAFIMATGEWLSGGKFWLSLIFCLKNS